jgi:hypothetical protein
MAKGGGKDKGETNTSGSAALEAFAKEMQEMSRPVREETFSQVLEGLKTGGIGARIPMITSAVEASPGATSNALRQIDDQNALMGTSGTFTGQRARADALMSGEQRTAQLPTGLVQAFIQNALGQITGTQQTAVQGYGGAADAQSRMYAANTNAAAQQQAALLQMFGSMGETAGTFWPKK